MVLLFSIITFGIYSIYWLVSTTNELRKNTKSAPNPKLLLLPVITFIFMLIGTFSYYLIDFNFGIFYLILLIFLIFLNSIIFLFYYYKYSKAINELTGFSVAGLFLLLIFVSPVGMILSQIELNKKSE